MDIGQVAQGVMVREHLMDSPPTGLPQNQYSHMLLGNLAWGSVESKARTAKAEHKIFMAGAAGNLKRLADGQYSPVAAASLGSPVAIAEALQNPSRKRRALAGSRLNPNVGPYEPASEETHGNKV